MGWDKAAEKRLAEVARCMEQPEAQNTQETAADIRAALDEIKRQRERADRLGERLADAQLAILAAQHEDALTTEAVLVQMGATRTQRERADRLEAELLDRRQGYDAPVPGLAEARQRIVTLEAALREMEMRLNGGLSCGIGPRTGMPLNPREREIITGILKMVRAALAAQPAQEGR